MTEASGDTPSVIDPGFLRQFVFATWWVGAVAGLVLVWRGGGRATDVACGAVAGAAAGVAGAATLACLTVLFDGAAAGGPRPPQRADGVAVAGDAAVGLPGAGLLDVHGRRSPAWRWGCSGRAGDASCRRPPRR